MLRIGADVQTMFEVNQDPSFINDDDDDGMDGFFEMLPRSLWHKAVENAGSVAATVQKELDSMNYGEPDSMLCGTVTNSQGIENQETSLTLTESGAQMMEWNTLEKGQVLVQVFMAPLSRISIDLSDLPPEEEKSLMWACTWSPGAEIETAYSVYARLNHLKKYFDMPEADSMRKALSKCYKWLKKEGADLEWSRPNYKEMIHIITSQKYQKKTRQIAKSALKVIATGDSLRQLSTAYTVGYLPAVILHNRNHKHVIEECVDNLDQILEDKNDGLLAILHPRNVFPFFRALKRHEQALKEMKIWI